MRSMTVAVLLLLAAVMAGANDIEVTEDTLSDGSVVLRHRTVVPAPLADVWAAFTTSEGWESWAVPFARVDLRVGGMIETSYSLDAVPGHPDNIRNRILSYLPLRMLSIRAERAPPGFVHAELLEALHSVIEFESVDEGHTAVTLSGVGYGQEPAFQELKSQFAAGNAWTLQRLRERFENGPVDWSTTLAPPLQD